MSGTLTVIFAGGGTGGHLFPGIAIAEALRAERPDARISFVGSRDKIEGRVVPRLGYEFDAIWIAGLARRFSLRTLLLPLKLGVALWQSMRIVRRRRPDVVVGTGGYAAGPLLWTAAKMGVPTLIHEQNEYPGITTRQLAPLAREVHVTYASSTKYLEATRIVVSGNPVRPSLKRFEAAEARRALGLHPGRPTLLAFGGSLGAASINRAIRGIVPRLVREEYQLIWQTGSKDFADLKSIGALYPGSVVVREFIDDMDTAYSAATMAVCRAGATSLAEITVLGIPSVLVPYPHAAADHQRRNAKAMAESGAAVVIEDERVGNELERVVFSLLDDDASLRAMAERTSELARPMAAQEIAGAVLRLSASTSGHGG